MNEDPEWLVRLKEEFNQLDNRIDKLEKFIKSPLYDNLDLERRELLYQQSLVMHNLWDILKARLIVEGIPAHTFSDM